MIAPQIFLASDLSTARRLAWQTISQSAEPLHPPLVFARAAAFASFRALAREGGRATLLPRLSEAENWFARAHATNARAKILAGTDRLWVLAALVRERGEEFPQLRLSEEPAQLREIVALLAQLRRANRAAFESKNDLWLDEFNRFVALYDARLREANAFDFEAAPTLFETFAARNQAFLWPETLLVDDECEISPVLQLGLRALAKRARVVATLACPGDETDPALQKALGFWRELGANFQNLTPNSARSSVARALLGTETTTFLSAPPAVLQTTAHTSWDEFNRIAAHIRRGLDAGQRARDFCLVAPRNLETEIRGAFEAHGVWLDWPRAPDWMASPLVARLLRLLDAPREGFSIHVLHDLFGDGALRFSIQNKGSEDRAQTFENAILTPQNGTGDLEESDGLALSMQNHSASGETELQSFNARRLRQAWLCVRGEDVLAPWRDAEKTAHRWEKQLESWTGSRAGRSDDKKAALVAACLQNGDLEALAALKTLLAPLQKPLGATQWANVCAQVLASVAAHWNDEESEAATLARAQIEALQNAIKSVQARAADVDFERDESVEIARAAGSWMAWLRLELGAHKPLENGERRLEGARFLSLEHVGEAFGGSESQVFVAGLSQRAWPLAPSHSGLVGRAESALKELHLGQSTPLARATHDLARLLAAIENGGKTLFLSRAVWEAGREVEASPLWDDLRALWPKNARFESLPALESQVPTSRARWLQSQNARSSHELPELLKIGAQMRAARENAHEIGVYDGVLGASGAQILRRHENDELPTFSPSALENYARCPISYFFGRVLNLAEDGENGDDLDAAEAGNLIHEILFTLRHEWAAPLSAAIFEAAREFLGEIARARCEQLSLVPILREAEFQRLMGCDERPGPLVKLLRAECLEADNAPNGNGAWPQRLFPLVHLAAGNIAVAGRDAQFWQPHDGQRGLEHQISVEVGGVRVKGVLDRLDVAPDGSMALVIDYKTGAPTALPNFSKGDDGLSFQLAIYLLGAAQIFQNHALSPRLAASYLSLRGGEFRGGVGQMESSVKNFRALDDSQWNDWMEEVARRIAHIASGIENGVFNLSLQTAKVAKCEVCGHRQLCGQNANVQSARATHLEGSSAFYLPEVWDF